MRFGIIILADQRWQDSARRWRLAEEYGFDHSYAITTACNADDQATLSADPDGNRALTCYDGDGSVTQTVLPSGVAWRCCRSSNLAPALSCGTAARRGAHILICGLHSLPGGVQQKGEIVCSSNGPQLFAGGSLLP